MGNSCRLDLRLFLSGAPIPWFGSMAGGGAGFANGEVGRR